MRRSLSAAQPRPSLLSSAIGIKNDQAANSTTATVQIPTAMNAFRGDVVIVKLTSGTFRLPGTGIASLGGTASITWAPSAAVDIRPAAGACPQMMYMGVITASGTIQPTANFVSSDTATSNTTTIALIVERYGNAQFSTAPRIGTQLVQTSTPSPNNGPWSSTYTPTHAQAIFTYMISDFNAQSGSPITYLNSSVETQNFYLNNILGLWSAYQPSFHAGQGQTFGVSSPSGQRVTAQGVEIRPVAA